MGAHICHYKYRCDVAAHPSAAVLEWFYAQDDKEVVTWTHVGEDGMPEEITQALLAAGCEHGDPVMLALNC